MKIKKRKPTCHAQSYLTSHLILSTRYRSICATSILLLYDILLTAIVIFKKKNKRHNDSHNDSHDSSFEACHPRQVPRCSRKTRRPIAAVWRRQPTVRLLLSTALPPWPGSSTAYCAKLARPHFDFLPPIPSLLPAPIHHHLHHLHHQPPPFPIAIACQFRDLAEHPLAPCNSPA